MAQPLPNASRELRGTNSGIAVALDGQLWLGQSMRHTGDAFQATGDGSDLSTDESTMVVAADTTTSALTVTIESATAEEGRMLYIFDAGGNATTNAITISAGTGVTLHSDSGNIANDNDARMYISDGTDFWEVAASG